jgi:hypothetical protein
MGRGATYEYRRQDLGGYHVRCGLVCCEGREVGFVSLLELLYRAWLFTRFIMDPLLGFSVCG